MHVCLVYVSTRKIWYELRRLQIQRLVHGTIHIVPLCLFNLP